MANKPSLQSEPSISSNLRQALTEKAHVDQQTGIRSLFSKQPERAEEFSFAIEDIHFDFSKTHITHDLVSMYQSFAAEIGFDGWRHDLFSGVHINATEDRAVLHTLLRDPKNQGIATQDPDFLDQAESAKRQFAEQYQTIQQQLASRETPVTDIIHVGIGGSALGTQLLFESLKELADTTRIHFIGNIDAHQLVAVLQQCDVSSTLVIGVSKTFSTAETLKNINSIGEWYRSNGVDNYLQSVYAVTANPANAASFGVPDSNTVTFPEWVGGRYSVWSSVSLSAALVLGFDKFEAFLDGAAAIDKHFYQSKPAENICFIAAMMDHYYSNFFESGSRAIFAYDYRLRSLVDYLQQLETESNGKDRQRDGSAADQNTSPVVWGGVGTDVQHSVFQLLHQGTAMIPAEFLLVVEPDHAMLDHHTELLANGLAQSAALLSGQDLDTVNSLHGDEGITDLAAKAKIFSGNRPSTTLLLKKLSPRLLGSLLAFYEHRTFCNGVFTNINSFDQMGVELGKRLARDLQPRLSLESARQMPGDANAEFDASTETLIRRLRD
ncbi:MAG: glucose-6-phosphate isomerase [Gammaproteobacteria bacterium]|nr:glucose-6-phosphate isomerase [Gammaproteobacteria bacterium]